MQGAAVVMEMKRAFWKGVGKLGEGCLQLEDERWLFGEIAERKKMSGLKERGPRAQIAGK